MATRFHTYGREPNTRRQFFGLVGMALAGAALGIAARDAQPKPPGLRPVWRKTADGWERVRMFELRVGDRIRVERHPTLDETGTETVEGVVHSAPELVEGNWSVSVAPADEPQTVSLP